MELIIITPLYQQKHDVAWLEVKTVAGSFVIQQGHVPTVLVLMPQQKITFGLPNGKRESLMIYQGTAHITRTSATLLLNDRA